MKIEKILIVEDEFIVAHDLQMILQRAGYQVVGIADSVKNAQTLLEKHQVGLVLLDIYLKGRLTGIDLAHDLMKREIPFIYISANSNERVLEAAKSTCPYGFIVKPYRERDILLSIDIARYRKENSNNMKMSSERFMQDFIVDISMKSLSWQKKILAISAAFQPYIPFDFIALSGIARDKRRYGEIGITRKNFDQYDLFTANEFLKYMGLSRADYDTINQLVPETTADAIYIGDDFEGVKRAAPMKNLIATTYHLYSNLVKTFYLENGDQISFSFYSRTENIYQPAHMELLNFLSGTLEKKLAHIIELEKAGIKSVLHQESDYPLAKKDFENIIGKSTALLSVLDKIKIVAPTDTSVLITGESGTGKEEIAKSIHRLSHRNTKPIVAVNCAALPADLIESILFGHEKGAFTGAINSRVGKFEEANGGTIFLDEIGEMPFDLQAKLLRVLQEKEIERIGGKQPVKVDLRIIAATNLNLEKEIAKGRFRLDLFYRLNVFPIHVPKLCMRKTDIPLLAEYFLQKHAKAVGKNIAEIPTDFMDRLMLYDWPGNIRELEHVMLRSILLSSNGVLNPDHLELGIKKEDPLTQNGIKTIIDNERDHIIRVLELCKGKVAGSGGAAELLGIPATTLNSKIKKLGIKR
ncbi:sigma 54-interacting transcriptional regulator [Pedobacter sp. WC2501]|uniref:sigma 54-interacting transcriptional regulator n=1 Tax=Pedobacter sp. WC2501 TaxID=3461400 RepID=UPI0040465DD5